MVFSELLFQSVAPKKMSQVCPSWDIFGWLFHGQTSDDVWSFRSSSFNTSRKKNAKNGGTNWSDADAAFDRAINEKRGTYNDRVARCRCAFVVLAARTGGRWHADCIRRDRRVRPGALSRFFRTRRFAPVYATRLSTTLVEPSFCGSTQINCCRPRPFFRCGGWNVPGSFGY